MILIVWQLISCSSSSFWKEDAYVQKDLPAAFGRRIRELRAKLGLSQEAFADRCGLHRTYVGGIERGERNPSLVNIGRMAVALNVSLNQLFTGAEFDRDGAT